MSIVRTSSNWSATFGQWSFHVESRSASLLTITHDPANRAAASGPLHTIAATPRSRNANTTGGRPYTWAIAVSDRGRINSVMELAA